MTWPQPEDYSGPLDTSTGISWVEMALSYMVDQCSLLPVIRTGQCGAKFVQELATRAQALEHKTTISEQAVNFRLVLEHTTALQAEQFWPDHLPRRKGSSLYLLGHGRHTQGLRCRPMIPHQDTVTRLLLDQFQRQKKSLDWIPELPFDGQYGVLQSDWQSRVRHAKNAMYRVRQLRA